jgi:endonuclease-8
VWIAAHKLRAALAGEELTKTDFRVPRYVTVDLSGRTVEDVQSRGKHLLWRLAGGVTLHTHFQMDGAWELYRPGERWRSPSHEARAVMHTSRWIAVAFRVPVLDLLPTAEETKVVGHLGPDVLGEDWDAAEAVERLRARHPAPVGDALLDQSALAGVGNVYKCEVCWLRGVDPWTPVGDVAELERLVDLTKRIMEANRFRLRRSTTGDHRPGRTHYVYGRHRMPCRRCGTSIRRAGGHRPGGERVTYWCPNCQRPHERSPRPLEQTHAGRGPS